MTVCCLADVSQVFSGTIISSIVKDGSLKTTAEYQLLLGALALPGVSDAHSSKSLSEPG